MTEHFLRRSDVIRLTGLSGSYIEKLVARGKFPEPSKIRERAIA
jgi:predicted DNA-binding transcriptional regulator AlpA